MDKYIEYFSCRDDFYNDILDILSGDSNNDRANQIIDLFDDLPTADVQPVKRGKWEQLVSKQSGLNYEVGARCSCCNEHTVTICICEAMPFEFCPHCGAKMIKDGDSE